MSDEQIRILAFGNISLNNSNEKDKNKTNKGSNKMNNKKINEVKDVTKVLQINKEMIKTFYDNASQADRDWMKQRTAQLMMETGKSSYFQKFRVEFAKKYFPELISQKKASSNKTLLDMFLEN